MRRSSTTLLLAAICLAPTMIRADEPADAPKGDLAKLQGSWTGKVGPTKDWPVTLTFKGTEVTLAGSFNGNDFEVVGAIKLDEKASPKTLDYIKFKTPDGDDVPTNLGIYKVEGDTFTSCTGGPGNDRPTEFKEGATGPPSLTTFTRVKKAEAPKDPEAKKADAPKGDLAKLQGKWRGTIGPGKDRTVTLEIRGSDCDAEYPGDDGTTHAIAGKVKLDESTTPPKVDFADFKSPAGGELPGTLGLYKLEGATWTLCTGDPGEPRPAAFKAGEGDGSPRVWTLKKVD